MQMFIVTNLFTYFSTLAYPFVHINFSQAMILGIFSVISNPRWGLLLCFYFYLLMVPFLFHKAKENFQLSTYPGHVLQRKVSLGVGLAVTKPCFRFCLLLNHCFLCNFKLLKKWLSGFLVFQLPFKYLIIFNERFQSKPESRLKH